MMKKTLAVLLSASMVFQAGAPVFAGVPVSSAEPKLYYTALGDSVGAGLAFDQAEEVRTSYNVFDTYKNSYRMSYPYQTALRLKEAALEEGYITDESEFDFSNLSIGGLNAQDIVNILTYGDDDDRVFAEYFKSSYEQYEAEREQRAALGEVAFKNNFRSLALQGGVIGGSETLALAAALQSYRGLTNLSSVDAQSVLAALAIYGIAYADKEEFDQWYDESFLNTSGGFDETKFQTWFDGNFDSVYENFLYIIEGRAYRWHDLFETEIKKSDYITFDLGANSVLQDCLPLMNEIAMGEPKSEENPDGYYWVQDVEVEAGDEAGGMEDFFLGGNGDFNNDTGHYENLDYPVLYILLQTVLNLTVAGEDGMSAVSNYISKYRSQITLQNIRSAIQYMRSDAIEQLLDGYIDGLMPTISDAVDLIQGIKKDDAVIGLVGRYAPYGKDLVLDGETRNLRYVLKAVITSLLSSADSDTEEVRALTDEAFSGMDSYSEEELDKELDKFDKAYAAFEAVRYPLVYLTIGRKAASVMQYYNEKLEEVAEEKDVIYIDSYDIPNHDSFDPHPGPEGQVAIAEHVADAFISDMTVEIVGNGTLSPAVSTGAKVLYGHDVTYQAVPEEGNELKSLTVNGEDKTGIVDENGQFTLENVTEDTSIQVTFIDPNQKDESSSSKPYTVILSLLRRIRTILSRTGKITLRQIFSGTYSDQAGSILEGFGFLKSLYK